MGNISTLYGTSKHIKFSDNFGMIEFVFFKETNCVISQEEYAWIDYYN